MYVKGSVFVVSPCWKNLVTRSVMRRMSFRRMCVQGTLVADGTYQTFMSHLNIVPLWHPGLYLGIAEIPLQGVCLGGDILFHIGRLLRVPVW
jgi:hypothetical protein